MSTQRRISVGVLNHDLCRQRFTRWTHARPLLVASNTGGHTGVLSFRTAQSLTVSPSVASRIFPTSTGFHHGSALTEAQHTNIMRVQDAFTDRALATMVAVTPA